MVRSFVLLVLSSLLWTYATVPAAAVPTFAAFGWIAEPAEGSEYGSHNGGAHVPMATYGQGVRISGANANALFFVQVSLHLEYDGGNLLDWDVFDSIIRCDGMGNWEYLAEGDGTLEGHIGLLAGQHSVTVYSDILDHNNANHRATHQHSHTFTVN